jgi:hypothetical protein
VKRILAVLFVLVTATSAHAAPIVVSFNSDSPGGKANGFASVDSALVTFSDTAGANLVVSSELESNFSPALIIPHEFDGSKLQMNFGAAIGFLSLQFGNDDPFWSAAGDLAWLQVFNGGTLVGTSTVVMNRNDLMDQTIVFSGPAFNSALFWYGNPAGSSSTGGAGQNGGLTEVVDNITFEAAAVPEPGTLTLLGLGLVGGAWRRRRS